jgi:prepilin-type N-terminal cleavage/methylation domain-containing protein
MMKKGFTLIEILIVVAIIAILASVVLVGLGPTQQAGRDARRASDLHEVQNGLELYFNKCGYYPGTGASGVCAAGSSESYATMSAALTGIGVGVNSVPVDPTNSGSHVYLYGEQIAGGTPTAYMLSATMENGSGTVFSGYNIPGNYGSMAWSATPPNKCAAPDYCVTL